ncbi:ornithine cyclodeaminase family protein [Streptomyces odontomachi]|uniref:ornithine cyclodeaminase family protein n=1 Tax=Streptomyces odontomachi TaxID=2944940 RepID=UPI00210A90A8|nr:ornithine cyclodeaminase family protein [Streptomyces sp. ODS25]
MDPRTAEPLLLLGPSALDGLVDLDTAIATQRRAFLALGAGTAQLAPRALLPGEGGSVVFSYTARISPAGSPVVKLGSVVPENRERGLPRVSAAVLALDPVTGRPAALIDGEAVTTLRTVAASMLAAQALSGSPSKAAVFGSGRQGRGHVSALARLFDVEQIAVCSPSDTTLDDFSARVAAETGTRVLPCPSAEAAVTGADLVVTCTTSTHPVVRRAWLAPGTTLISIGSFAPDRHEVGSDVVTGSRVIVDDVATASVQAGPVATALAAGEISEQALLSLGDVLAGKTPARLRDDDIVYFNSVGLGVQDAAFADEVLKRARATGAGRPLDW